MTGTVGGLRLRPVSLTARLAVALAFVVVPYLSSWLGFLLTVAFSKGLVILGVMLLMRAGLVSFGQGLFFAAGGYAVGFAMKLVGLRELPLLVALGMGTSALMAAVAGPLVARYREIFFAMLTLALSMVLYGVLLNAYWLTGGTDGLGIHQTTLLGRELAGESLRRVYYYTALILAALCVALARRWEAAPAGFTGQAIRMNEIRLEYLGTSVQAAVLETYLLAGALGGLGGALTAFAVGHVTPEMAYWTTSGEFVVVSLLGGTGSVLAPFAASAAFEVLRSYASKYSPYTWQLVVGAIMLGVILFLPGGMWSVYRKLGQRGQR